MLPSVEAIFACPIASPGGGFEFITQHAFPVADDSFRDVFHDLCDPRLDRIITRADLDALLAMAKQLRTDMD
jgi:hypothetical protein